MVKDIPASLVIAATVIILAAVAAFVILVVSGYAADAATLPIFLSALVPVFISHAKLQRTATDTNSKVTHALNGGMKEAMRQVVRTELTTLVAHDEASGTTTVENAARQAQTSGLPPSPPEGG